MNPWGESTGMSRTLNTTIPARRSWQKLIAPRVDLTKSEPIALESRYGWSEPSGQ